MLIFCVFPDHHFLVVECMSKKVEHADPRAGSNLVSTSDATLSGIRAPEENQQFLVGGAVRENLRK